MVTVVEYGNPRKRMIASSSSDRPAKRFALRRVQTRSIGTQKGRSFIKQTRQRTSGPSKMVQKLKKWNNKRAFPRITGRGDYRTTIKSIGKAVQRAGQLYVPRGTFSKMGGYLGSAAGGYLSGGAPNAMVAGAGLGGFAGDKFAQAVGFGDYHIKKNSLMNGMAPMKMGQQVAAFGNMSSATIVKHREYIREIKIPTVPGDFVNTLLPLNPGLRSVFPWLSNIAAQYQEYQWIGCIFEFRSLTSDSAAVLQLGSVIMASNYDTAEPLYVDKRHMENSQFAVSAKPSKGMIHPIECDPSVTFVPIKYVRTGGLAPGTDSRLYDHCNVQVATEGLPVGSTGSIGELWVSYEVALYKPNLGIGASLRDHFYGTTATVGAIANVSPLGANPTALVPNGGDFAGLGCRLKATAITFPRGIAAGDYEVTLTYLGPAGFGLTTPTFSSASAAITLVNYYAGATAAQVGTTGGDVAPSLREFVLCHIRIPQPLTDAVDLALAATFDLAATEYDLQIAALPDGQL